jgi:uncharacterized protein involved in exopolysaccharide biosynthesis
MSIFTIAGATYALIAEPVYRAECVLAPNKLEQGASLAAGLGGLSSLAGINLGVSPDTTDALATLQSRVFVEEFIEENNLMPILFADLWDPANERWVGDNPDDWPDIRDAVQYFIDEVRTVDVDAATGLTWLGIIWTDPELAAGWTEMLVDRINERLRSRDLAASERRLAHLYEQLELANLVELRQAISRLIESEIQTMTLARAEIEYAFKIIDPPRVPMDQIAPRPLPIVFFASLLGGLIGLSVALVSGWRTFAYRDGAADECR